MNSYCLILMRPRSGGEWTPGLIEPIADPQEARRIARDLSEASLYFDYTVKTYKARHQCT